MQDKNGREIRTGDIVRVSGAYFKTSNGTFYVSNLDTGRTLWLHRIKKNGEICMDTASSTQSWPLSSYCSDRRKNALAKEHNKEHAEIEVVDDVNTWHVAEHFRKQAQERQEAAENIRRRGDGRGDADACEEYARQYSAVVERLSESAVEPPAKEPEHGIKFYWNGIKVDGGRLIPCHFWLGENKVNISAKDYKDLPREYFTVENNSDSYTDYFERDHATVTPEHPLYRFARYVTLKGIMNGKTYRKPTEEQVREWSSMKDPGQPTATDLKAVEDMKLAQENARKAKEQAEQLERREEALRRRSEGRNYIESVMEQWPLRDGEPSVEIPFSEDPAFYSWTTSVDQTVTEVKVKADGTTEEQTRVVTPRRRLVMSVAAAEIILKHYDEDMAARHEGYNKTDFIVRWPDPETGEEHSYEGRYDLGDNDGGLIEHIRAFGRSIKQDEEAQEQICGLADMLEQYTAGGRVVSVEVAPQIVDFVRAKKEREQEQRKQEVDMLFAQVAMLTVEQLTEAVMLIDPHDKEKEDVARFFLQELNRRDKKTAFEVFKRWKTGEGA